MLKFSNKATKTTAIHIFLLSVLLTLSEQENIFAIYSCLLIETITQINESKNVHDLSNLTGSTLVAFFYSKKFFSEVVDHGACIFLITNSFVRT